MTFVSFTVNGALLLACRRIFMGTRAQEDLIAAVLLLFGSTFLFAFFVLPQTPLLWPTLVLWVAIVVWLIRKRFARMVTIVAAMILIAVSAWYCVFYIPVQMQRALTHVGNGAAPPFTLQPISRESGADSLYTRQNSRARFFRTWCSPCIAELPELERVRADLQTRRDIEFVLVGTNKGGDTPDRVRAFAQHRHISLPVAFDPEQATMGAFGLNGFPNLVVIDRTGHVRLTHTGYNSSETSFRRDLTQLLQSL